jgi:hypothetical protein
MRRLSTTEAQEFLARHPIQRRDIPAPGLLVLDVHYGLTRSILLYPLRDGRLFLVDVSDLIPWYQEIGLSGSTWTPEAGFGESVMRQLTAGTDPAKPLLPDLGSALQPIYLLLGLGIALVFLVRR